ncbi:MAG: THUMP domain-containing protein [Myxococcaceae bacterium]|nr:THUMP domain-containing protein [Myxococcaceae bacterium]MCI0670380.1 THUMP domain-containing protein [Myxococcaceae bacterium]
MAERFALFATTARGTEDLLTTELTELGARRVRQDRGGVRFLANLDEALRISLWSRIAMRVLLPLGDEADAPGGEGLYEAARAIPWEDHLTPDSTFAVEATIRDSQVTHSGFAALKVKDALVDRLREKAGGRPDVDTQQPDVRVVAHLAKDRLSLSLDLCGEPLHRRGYRARPTPAPLKETLAAAILRAEGYNGEEPFLDPMCGSGTLAIEAALIARNRAPGLHRRFSVERWPHLGARAEALLEALRQDARAHERKVEVPIVARDKDEEALEATRRNVAAARLSAEVQVELRDVLKGAPPPAPSGLLATNPPYGDRLEGGRGQKGMKSFYFKLGDVLGGLEGWRLSVLAGNEAFESAFHQRPLRRRALWNGPIPCTLLSYAPRAPREER